MNARLKKLSATALALSSAAFLIAQSDQSKPSAYQSNARDETKSGPATDQPAEKQAPQEKQTARTPAPAAGNTDSASNTTKAPAPDNTNATAQSAATPSAQNNASAGGKADAPRPNITLASKDVKDRTAKKFSGNHVRSSEGRDLG